MQVTLAPSLHAYISLRTGLRAFPSLSLQRKRFLGRLGSVWRVLVMVALQRDDEPESCPYCRWHFGCVMNNKNCPPTSWYSLSFSLSFSPPKVSPHPLILTFCTYFGHAPPQHWGLHSGLADASRTPELRLTVLKAVRSLDVLRFSW